MPSLYRKLRLSLPGLLSSFTVLTLFMRPTGAKDCSSVGQGGINKAREKPAEAKIIASKAGLQQLQGRGPLSSLKSCVGQNTYLDM